MPANPRVLMIGLDALDHRLFERLCAAGRLPNFAAFAASANRLEVASDGDILHGSVWPTFASSTGPGSHGVYFWTQWLAEEMRHVRNNHPAFAYDAWWKAALDAGLDVAVVDVPYVPAIEHPRLRQFTGWGLHDEVEPQSWPPTFGKEIVSRFGHHPLKFDTVEPANGHDKLVMTREMRRGAHLRAKVLEWLLADGRSNLVATSFSEFHKAGHYLTAPQQLSDRYTNIDAFAAVAGALDRRLPAILQAAGPDTHVFIFALHGMQEQRPYDQFGRQLADLINGREPVDTASHPDLLRRVRNLVPDPVHRAIWQRLPASVRAARQGQLSIAGLDIETDALLTVAHDQHPTFRVNEKGRERDGIVSREDGERLLQKLWGLAGGMRAEDGRNAFTQLYRPQAVHPGERAHRLPDAMLVANSEVRRTSRLETPDGRVLFSSRPEARNGVHTNTGFCLYRPAEGGPNVARGHMDNLDFGPTALELLGVPVPGSLQGASVLR